MFPGASHHNIELTVYGDITLNESLLCKEIELCRVADGKSVYDNIALASLIALNGVYGDII